MCISFFYLSPNPNSGSFSLILAFNRDEYFSRPTSPMSWGDDGLLCSRDMQPGREGGTWLAANKEGRIAFVTNISTGKNEKSGKGRGRLVTDYLTQNISAEEYLNKLASSPDQYNPFNLCLFELNQDKVYQCYYYCRGKIGHVVNSEGPLKLDSGFHGLSNHPYTKPFKKTNVGGEIFKEAIEKFNDDKKHHLLIEELSKLMKNNKVHFPDDQYLEQAGHLIASTLSSICIDVGFYGTRTHTFITVDHNLNVHYLEQNKETNWSSDSIQYKVKF